MSSVRGLVLDSIFYSVPSLNILQGAYLKVRPGSICALFGRNGSGKTTLLRVAAGQIRAASGLTIIDGDRLRKFARQRRFKSLAYLAQKSMLPPDITVAALIRAVGPRKLRHDALLRKVLPRRIEELSGGERRYLEVALVLGLGRSYVLLDEPFSGVEPAIIDRISDKIRSAANAGAGILITDHYYRYVLPLADNAYLMRQKQCFPLKGDVRAELSRFGYM